MGKTLADKVWEALACVHDQLAGAPTGSSRFESRGQVTRAQKIRFTIHAILGLRMSVFAWVLSASFADYRYQELV